MVTTRDLEQVVESALLDAGVSEERARAAAARLGDELVQLPTKADLDERFRQSEERTNERFNAVNERFDAVDHRFDALNQRIDELREDSNRRFTELREDAIRRDEEFREDTNRRDEALRSSFNQRLEDLRELTLRMDRSNWRLTLMTMGLWSATFGALMYAVFGA